MNRAWTTDKRIGAALIRRARAVVSATLRGTDVPSATLPSRVIPVRIHGVGVTLYHQRMLGCWIGLGSDLDSALARGAARAARDPRYRPIPAECLPTLRIAVSVLCAPRRFGPCRKKRVAARLRLGFDTLGVASGKHFAMILESAAPHHSLTPLQLTTALLRKAHLTDKPVRWAAYATASWLETDRGVRRLQCGFCAESPERPTRATLKADLEQMARLLMSMLTSTGPKWYALNPITNLKVTRGTVEQAGIAYAALWHVGRCLSRHSWQRRGLQGLQTIRHSRMTLQTRLLIAATAEPAGLPSEQNDLTRRAMRDRVDIEAVLEVADAWVDMQDPSAGAITSDEEADVLTSYTAFATTRIAEAWCLALASGQRRRARRYERSWTAAIGHVRQLIIRSADAPMLREPSVSIGGVRVAQANAMISIDAAGHVMIAMIKGLQAMKMCGRAR